jgi:hypothetical protein
MAEYRILPWIDTNKLDTFSLSCNPKAITFLKANPEKIAWGYLSTNPAAISILKENKTKIFWNMFLSNTSIEAAQMIKENRDKITNWSRLCTNESEWINSVFDEEIIKTLNIDDLKELGQNPFALPTIEKFEKYIGNHGISINPNALHILKADPTKIRFIDLMRNSNPESINLFEQYFETIGTKQCYLFHICKYYYMIPYIIKNPHYIDKDIFENWHPDALPIIQKMFDSLEREGKFYRWKELSGNPIAIDILSNNIEHIDWEEFCELEVAVPVIELHIDKIDWSALSLNPGAMHILEKYPDRIHYGNLSLNDGIFEKIDKE